MRRLQGPRQSAHAPDADATFLSCELPAGVLSCASRMQVVCREVDSATALATATLIKTDVALVSSRYNVLRKLGGVSMDMVHECPAR